MMMYPAPYAGADDHTDEAITMVTSPHAPHEPHAPDEPLATADTPRVQEERPSERDHPEEARGDDAVVDEGQRLRVQTPRPVPSPSTEHDSQRTRSVCSGAGDVGAATASAARRDSVESVESIETYDQSPEVGVRTAAAPRDAAAPRPKPRLSLHPHVPTPRRPRAAATTTDPCPSTRLVATEHAMPGAGGRLDDAGDESVYDSTIPMPRTPPQTLEQLLTAQFSDPHGPTRPLSPLGLLLRVSEVEVREDERVVALAADGWDDEVPLANHDTVKKVRIALRPR